MNRAGILGFSLLGGLSYAGIVYLAGIPPLSAPSLGFGVLFGIGWAIVLIAVFDHLRLPPRSG